MKKGTRGQVAAAEIKVAELEPYRQARLNPVEALREELASIDCPKCRGEEEGIQTMLWARPHHVLKAARSHLDRTLSPLEALNAAKLEIREFHPGAEHFLDQACGKPLAVWMRERPRGKTILKELFRRAALFAKYAYDNRPRQ